MDFFQYYFKMINEMKCLEFKIEVRILILKILNDLLKVLFFGFLNGFLWTLLLNNFLYKM